MLRRFESIKDCGIFEDFRWNTSAPDFERINLIYGANGAGKTSLARALDSLDSASGGFASASIRMSNADKTNDRTSSHNHDDEFERIFVFSDRYVDRNHDFGGETELEAVLTLSERTVEDEKRIGELRELIKNLESDLINASKALRDADRSLDDEHTSVSRNVVNALSRAGGEYRSAGSYSKGTVKARFAGSHSGWVLLSAKDREAALATVTSDERQPVTTKSYSLSVRTDLAEQVSAALTNSPVSVVLDTLRDHDEASSWVDMGRHIHKGLEKCIFCGGELTDERKKQIEQHFSDEVEEAQRTTDSLIREVKALRASSEALLGDGALAGSLFSDLRDSFKTAHATAKTQVVELNEWLEGLLGALEEKRKNVVSSVEHEIVDAPTVDGSEIERILTEHNERVSQHAKLVQEAAKKVEFHLLKEAEVRVTVLNEASKKAAKAKSDIEETLRHHREEVAALENVEGDPLPSAEVMAKELARILGRSELSFELLPDGKHYRVTRHGEPARDLSKGERTAITLIHFLENVKRANTNTGKPIVVIDDPVSSLDSGNAMGISTYIWAEAVAKDHIEQVIMLTHNFELFRQWDIQIDGLHKNRAERAANPAVRYELTAPHSTVGGFTKRRPVLAAWPPSDDARTKLRSSYHHAFLGIVREHKKLSESDTLDNRLDAQLLFPNVLRRVLESFMAFKRPELVGSFTNVMRQSTEMLKEAGYAGDADALRMLLTRFTHAFSHDESPETDFTVNPDEIRPAIASVFIFMNAIDQKHFEGLCKVIGVEPAFLLLESQAVTSFQELDEGVK